MSDRYKNYFLVSLILVIGIGLSTALFIRLEKNELQFTNEKFSHLITQYANAVDYALAKEKDSLNALSAYHYGSENISRAEFQEFTSTVLRYDNNIQALEWVPKVINSEKIEYEKSVKFTEKDDSGNIIPVHNRMIYYPVYFLEPYKGNEMDLGFDFASDKTRLNTLNIAANTGDVISTPPIELRQVKEQKLGIIMAQPIYKDKNDKASLEGFYLNIIETNVLVEHMLSKISKQCQGVNLDIYDITSNDKALVYSRVCKCKKEEISSIKAFQTITVAGRIWRFEATATRTFLDQFTTIYPSLVFTISILLTILIAIVFYLMQKSYKVVLESNNHLRRFQKLAVGREQRISELKLENKKLKKLQENFDEE